jgi:hypothetical protein
MAFALPGGEAVAEQAAKRHIIIGVDVSSSMAPSKGRGGGADPSAAERAMKYLTNILYSGPLASLPAPDKTIPLPSTPLPFGEPLYREGDILSFFTFAADTAYLFTRRAEFVPRSKLESAVPKVFKGKWSLIKCADAEAYENYQPDDGETFFVRITDEEVDIDIQDKTKFHECVSRVTVYESDHFSRVQYALQVEGPKNRKIWITVSRIEGHVGPHPFFLVKADDPTKRVERMMFGETSGGRAKLKGDYRIAVNPKIKTDYAVTGLKAQVRDRDKDAVVYEAARVKKTMKPPVALSGFEIDKKFACDDYALDFVIDYTYGGKSRKGKDVRHDTFVIRNVGIRTGDAPPPPPPGEPFALSPADRLDLKESGNMYHGDMSLGLKPGVPGEYVRIGAVEFQANDSAVKPDVTRSGDNRFPVALKIEAPAARVKPGSTVQGKLVITWSNAKATDKDYVQTIELALRAPDPQVFAPPPPDEPFQLSPVGALDLKDEAGEYQGETSLSFKPGVPEENVAIKRVEYLANDGGLRLDLTPWGKTRAPIRFKIATSPEAVKCGKPTPGQILVRWANAKAPGKDYTQTFDLTLRTPPCPCRDLLSLTNAPDSNRPVTEAQAAWQKGVLQLPDLFVNLNRAVAGGDRQTPVGDARYRVSGLGDIEGDIPKVPHKISPIVAQDVLKTLAPGKRDLKITLGYKDPDASGPCSQTFTVTLVIPEKPAVKPPVFTLHSGPQDPNPLKTLTLEKEGDKWAVKDMFLKAAPVGVTGIPKVELKSDQAVLATWNNPQQGKDGVFTLPRKTLTVSTLPPPNAPTKVVVSYAQDGLDKPGAVTIPGPVLTLPPKAWVEIILDAIRDYGPTVLWGLLYLLGALVAAAAAYVFYRFLKGRFGPKPPPPPLSFRIRLHQALGLPYIESEVFTLAPGDKVGLGPEPSWPQAWGQPNAPLHCIEYDSQTKRLCHASVTGPEKTPVDFYTAYQFERTEGAGDFVTIELVQEEPEETEPAPQE